MKYLLLLLHTAVRHTLGKFYLSSPLFYFIVRARSGSVSLCTWAHSPRSKTAKTQAKNTHSLGLGWTPLFLVSLLFSLLLLLFFFFFLLQHVQYNLSRKPERIKPKGPILFPRSFRPIPRVFFLLLHQNIAISTAKCQQYC